MTSNVCPMWTCQPTNSVERIFPLQEEFEAHLEGYDMLNRNILSALALGGAALANPAAASEEEPSIEVSYSDLDLTTQAGERELIRRVRRAAKRLCPYEVGTRGFAERFRVRACARRARIEAKTQVQLAIQNARNARFANVESLLRD